MYRVAVLALSALAITVAAPTAFAEDRTAKVDDSAHADSSMLMSDGALPATAEAAVSPGADRRSASFRACLGSTPTSPDTEGCQTIGQKTSSLTRSIDWSAVGPSTDDFARDEDSLRLVGARLVGSFKF